jgi:hypothetical protein
MEKAMTVAELIKALSTLDPQAKVFVNGYEDGYNEASRAVPGLFDEGGFRDPETGETPSYYGRWDLAANRSSKGDYWLPPTRTDVEGVFLG